MSRASRGTPARLGAGQEAWSLSLSLLMLLEVLRLCLLEIELVVNLVYYSCTPVKCGCHFAVVQNRVAIAYEQCMLFDLNLLQRVLEATPQCE